MTRISFTVSFKSAYEVRVNPWLNFRVGSVNVPPVSNADDSDDQNVILDFVDNPKVAFANPV
ncbi:MAG TPA: hypothetical protein VFR78_02770 [Pyrinomonadaceae bacterium]|nr:hypothetical protein [Pyrinomonadaceae bacterium]